MKTCKYSLIVASLFSFLSASADGQDTPAVDLLKDTPTAKTPLVNDLDGEKSGDWKAMLEKRSADNQKFATQLRNANEAKGLVAFRDGVLTVAEQLPIESHIRKQLNAIAANVSDTADETSSELESNASNGLTLAEAKSRVEALSEQLAFKPRLETALPANFTPPTPVGEIEIKRYDSYRMAKTSSKNGSAFFKLFNHIQKEKIEMTSPVEMHYDATTGKIAESQMAFLYPDQETGKLDDAGDVTVVDVEPTTVISMGMRGRPNVNDIAKAEAQLRDASLHFASKFELKKSVRVLGYNGPSVPPKDQFFEIQIEIIPPGNAVKQKAH